MLSELSEGGEQIPAWKREFEERQRDEAFGNALLNKIRQSRGNRYPYFVCASILCRNEQICNKAQKHKIGSTVLYCSFW